MTYSEVLRSVEAVLLAMVAEGRAEFHGVGPHGPLYAAEGAEVWSRLQDAGLLADEVPWCYPAAAVARLRVEGTT